MFFIEFIAAEQIIKGNIQIIGDFYQHRIGRLPMTAFVISIRTNFHIQMICHLLCGKPALMSDFIQANPKHFVFLQVLTVFTLYTIIDIHTVFIMNTII